MEKYKNIILGLKNICLNTFLESKSCVVIIIDITWLCGRSFIIWSERCLIIIAKLCHRGYVSDNCESSRELSRNDERPVSGKMTEHDRPKWNIRGSRDPHNWILLIEDYLKIYKNVKSSLVGSTPRTLPSIIIWILGLQDYWVYV